MKFGRHCKLSVEVEPDAKGVPTGNVTIPPQFTVEFDIERYFMSASQKGTFRIYNLAEKTRNLLRKDQYAMNVQRGVQFRAGYGNDPLQLCFNGQLMLADSYRRGHDFITEIEAFDGGFAMANAYTASTVAAGTSARDVIIKLAKSLPGTKGTPIVGNFDTSHPRARTLVGSTWGILLEESGNFCTIDNGQVKALKNNEAIEAPIPVITAASGLLGSPRRSATNLEFDILFEPSLTVGQLVSLESSTNKLFNGVYKVSGFRHHGVISPVMSGECRSTVSLYFGQGDYNRVAGTLVT